MPLRVLLLWTIIFLMILTGEPTSCLILSGVIFIACRIAMEVGREIRNRVI